MTHRLSLRSILTIACLLCGAVNAQPSEPIATYEAFYDASYKGRTVGTFDVSVERDSDAATFLLTTTARFRGLLKLFRPNPVNEVSRFSYFDGELRPLEYRYEDGTRRGNDSFSVEFDWERRIATTRTEDEAFDSTVTPGMLDRGTMQVAVMRDMQRSVPERYTLVDEDGVRVYEYTADGEESLDTPLGLVATRKFVQQRPGSSRRTLIWMAPEMGFLPIRIEQQRDGETRAAFILQSVEWLDERK